jgi:hypothetical protein
MTSHSCYYNLLVFNISDSLITCTGIPVHTLGTVCLSTVNRELGQREKCEENQEI